MVVDYKTRESEAKKKESPFRMTPAYDILLRGSEDMPIGLYHLHMATAAQLCRPHYSMGSLKAVKAKLHELEKHYYVRHDGVPTKFTRSPYYYLLDNKYIRYLQAVGLDVADNYRSDKEVNKHSLFIEHTLGVNDVIISAALLKRSNPDYWLQSFVHEREIKHRPYRVSWKGDEITLIPDAVLDFRTRVESGERRMPVMLEHEISEKGQFAFRRKVRAYIILLKDRFREFGVTIAYTTTLGPSYLGKMREWTWQELHSTDEAESLGKLFCFADVGKPEPKEPIDPQKLWLGSVWYTAHDEPPITLLGV